MRTETGRARAPTPEDSHPMSTVVGTRNPLGGGLDTVSDHSHSLRAWTRRFASVSVLVSACVLSSEPCAPTRSSGGNSILCWRHEVESYTSVLDDEFSPDRGDGIDAMRAVKASIEMRVRSNQVFFQPRSRVLDTLATMDTIIVGDVHSIPLVAHSLTWIFDELARRSWKWGHDAMFMAEAIPETWTATGDGFSNSSGSSIEEEISLSGWTWPVDSYPSLLRELRWHGILTVGLRCPSSLSRMRPDSDHFGVDFAGTSPEVRAWRADCAALNDRVVTACSQIHSGKAQRAVAVLVGCAHALPIQHRLRVAGISVGVVFPFVPDWETVLLASKASTACTDGVEVWTSAYRLPPPDWCSDRWRPVSVR